MTNYVAPLIRFATCLSGLQHFRRRARYFHHRLGRMQTHLPALLSECGSSYRRRFSHWILLTFFVLAAGQLAYAADTIKVPMTNDGWTVTAGTVDFADYMGRPAISLKAGNYAKHIPTGAAVLKSVNFHNGTIE